MVAPPWTSGSGASWHWDVGSGSFGFCGLHSGVSMDPADVQSDCVFELIKPTALFGEAVAIRECFNNEGCAGLLG